MTAAVTEAPSGRAVDALVVLNGVSTFGSGLVYPYTALYFAGVPAFGSSGVSVFYGVMAAANLVTTALLALGWIRPSPALLGATGTVMLALGYFGVALAGSLPFLAGAVLLAGCGQGCLLVAMVPVLNSLVTAENRRATFARRYRAVNIGLGAGAVVAGVTAGIFSASVLPWLFVGNALSYIPLVVVFLLVRRRIPAEATKVADTPHTPLWRLGIPALLAAVFQLGAYLFGHSQFEATAPLVAVQLMGVSLGAVSGLLLVNTAVVVFGQKWVTARLAGRDEAFGLRVAVLLWAGAYVLVSLSAFGSLPVRLAGLGVFALVFALGECAYSCSYHPWLISSVSEKDITRVSALASSMMGVGMASGPSIGIALVFTGSASVVWICLAGMCLLLLFTLRGRSR